MIKKLLCLLLILSAAFVIVACKSEHEHELVKTEAKAATCTTEGTNAYWTCSGCEKVYADEAATTETTVEAQKISSLGHDFADATCTAPKTCKRTGCGVTEGEPAAHDYDETTWAYREADGHAHGCANCTAYGTVIPHTSSGEATEEVAETCTECGYEINPKKNHTHTPASGWTSDSDYHWHKCASGCDVVVGEKVAHEPGTDDHDCTTPTKCSVCGKAITEAKPNHQYTDECDTICNNDGCTQTRTDTAEHVDSNTDGKCDNCGEDYTENEGDGILTPPDPF